MNVPVARISRISFLTDARSGRAPTLPLGFMLEAAWPDEARWLGIIGRVSLLPEELGTINLATWPELRTPFSLLDKMFEAGWQAAWGEAGGVANNQNLYSSINVQIEEAGGIIAGTQIESEAAWANTCNLLFQRLVSFREILLPAAKPILVPMPAPHVHGIGGQQPKRTKIDVSDLRLAA